jgi:hypothetical protein
MPEHIHLLIAEPQHKTLADALKSLKQGVSRRLIGEAEHFWQTRYYDFNIRNRQQFAEKLLYIHRNPVKRGLCERPEDWEWSSFCHYATGMRGRVEIESEWTARRREMTAELSHSSQNKLEWGTEPRFAGCLQKAKGRFLLRDLALSVPIFGDPVLVPDHNACHPGIVRHPRATARAFT